MKFPKTERLTNKRIIDTLFKQGKSAFTYPFKLLYLENEPSSKEPTQVLISVPRKKLRKAVDRNWVKRRIREIYRLNKYQFEQTDGLYKISYLVIIYIAKEKIPYRIQEKKLLRLFKQLKK